MNVEKEIWKPVIGYESYYMVSDLGNIKSLDRIDRFNRKYNGRTLKQKKTRYGYSEVDLSISGKSKTVKIHRLVAELFIPNSENKSQVNHKNGIKTDNRAANLEWCTPKENVNHGIETGLIKRKGEENPCSKLTRREVQEIRQKYSSGNYSQRALAKEYSVNQRVIWDIVNNKKWV
jgi:hypothetical protein